MWGSLTRKGFKGLPSALERTFQGLEVATEEDVGSAARWDVTRTKSMSMTMTVRLLQKDLCNSSVWRNITSKTSLPLWELTGNYMRRFKMKMKLLFRASHQNADSERRCSSDLKHALLTTPAMLRMQMLPILLPVATCRRCPWGDWATAKFLLNQPNMKFHAIDPTMPCIQQEGFQLAEASFRDMN